MYLGRSRHRNERRTGKGREGWDENPLRQTGVGEGRVHRNRSVGGVTDGCLVPFRRAKSENVE